MNDWWAVEMWKRCLSVAVTGLLLVAMDAASARAIAATMPVLEGADALALFPGSTDESVALGINDANMVVGLREDQPFAGRAGGTMHDLSPLPGHFGGIAWAVNNHDLAVGASFPLSGRWRAVAFDLDAGSVSDLGDVPGFTEAEARDITDSGIVVGNGGVRTPATRAWFKEPGGSITLIPTLGGLRSGASAVNEAGIVVGWSSVAGEAAEHAFAYTIQTGELLDLGTLGGRDSAATDINEAGLVVGESARSDSRARAFLFDLSSPGMVELGTLGGNVSRASAINDAGTIVGSSSDETNSPFFGFAANLDAQPMIKLPGYPDALFAESAARAVNNANVAVGSARSPDVPDNTAAAWLLGSLPDAPNSPTVSGCATTADVSWTLPFDGNRPVLGSTVFRDGVPIAGLGADATSYQDTNASAGSAYAVQVSNELGAGPISAETVFVTEPCPPVVTTATTSTSTATTAAPTTTAPTEQEDAVTSPTAAPVIAEPMFAG